MDKGHWAYVECTSTAPQDITVDFLYNSIKKKRNWSAPGSDKITNVWIKKLTVLHKDLTSALTQIINSEITLPVWLQEGRCVMIPKKESPSAKDHRPITCLNTTYKAITSVINYAQQTRTTTPAHASRSTRMQAWINGLHRQPPH